MRGPWVDMGNDILSETLVLEQILIKILHEVLSKKPDLIELFKDLQNAFNLKNFEIT